jgi:hypothetical protein
MCYSFRKYLEVFLFLLKHFLINILKSPQFNHGFYLKDLFKTTILVLIIYPIEKNNKHTKSASKIE